MVVIKGSTPGVGSRGRALLRLVVEGVLDGDVVALREGAEAVDALHMPGLALPVGVMS